MLVQLVGSHGRPQNSACHFARLHLQGIRDVCQVQPGACLMMRQALPLVLGCLPGLMACSGIGPVKVAALEAVRALSSSSSTTVLGMLICLLLQWQAATLPLPGNLLHLG